MQSGCNKINIHEYRSTLPPLCFALFPLHASFHSKNFWKHFSRVGESNISARISVAPVGS